MFDATIIDAVLTLPQRRHAKVRGTEASGLQFRYVNTRFGRLRYVDTGGSKNILLLTPDGPCVIEHHRALIESLKSHFRVICFELPGLGFSYPSARFQFRIAQCADATLELMDALSIQQAVVAFTCVNGFFAMNLAARYPSRVSHLVLAQTPSLASMREWVHVNIPAPLRVPVVGQLVGAIGARTLARRWFDVSLPRPSDHKPGFVNIAQQTIRAGGCFCLSSLVQGTLRSPPQDVLGVKCPTLVIHGDADFSHRHTDFRSFNDEVSHARIVAFDGCGHFPNLERTDDYVRTIREFVGV